MIRFCGLIKREYEEKVIKLRSKQAAVLLILGAIIAEILGFVLFLIYRSTNDLYKFVVYGLIIIIIVLVDLVTSNSKRNFFEWNFDISIEENNIKVVYLHQNGVVENKPLRKIKKVIDYGGYYLLYFYRWDASYSIICQKDLLIEGSLEEFENTFAGKIKKSNKGDWSPF